MFTSSQLFEEKYWTSCLFDRVCGNEKLVVASGKDEMLRVWNLENAFTWWQCPEKITSIAVACSQIAVGTLEGKVFLLHCRIKNGILKLKQKSILSSNSSLPVYKVRLWNIENVTECLVFEKNQVYSSKWNVDTVESNIIVKALTENTSETSRQYHYYLDGVQTAPSTYLLVGIDEDRQNIVASANCHGVDKSTWRHGQKGAEYYLLDVSSTGWILVTDLKLRRTLLINIFTMSVCSTQPYFISGCLLSTSLTEVLYVLFSNYPSALGVYSLNIAKQKSKLLQSWGDMKLQNDSKNKQCATVAACNGNIFIILNDKTSHCSSVWLVHQSPEDIRSHTPFVTSFPKPYEPSWLQSSTSKHNRIIDSTYFPNTHILYGALLVQENECQYIRPWTYDDKDFRCTSLRVPDNENYTRIAMNQNITVLCSESLHNSVAVLFFQQSTELTATFTWSTCDVNSHVIKLISLESTKFCLATEKELIVFNEENVIYRHKIHQSSIKDLRFNPETRQLRVFTRTYIRTYDINLQAVSQKKHSIKFGDGEEWVIDTYGKTWVVIDDNYEELHFFQEGRSIVLTPYENRLSLLSLSKDGKLVFEDCSDGSEIRCFSLRGASISLDEDKVDWSLVRNYGFDLGKAQGYESSNRLFLSSNYNFSVIEADQSKRKERFLFGYEVPKWFDENDSN